MNDCCCSSSCCGKAVPKQMAVRGDAVFRVDSIITKKDLLKKIGFRLGIGRKRLTVSPGLYALGSPGTEAPVLVSANFRITFDQLRADMKGRDAWFLILDTKGINVWCAAGKGTFGTEELLRQIEASGLSKVVSHRRLILPQLGAPGIIAHEVEKQTGFRIHYGPVSSKDLPAYINAGLKASVEMRKKRFPLKDRAELIPLELVQSWKVIAALSSLSILLTGLLRGIEAITFLYDVIPSLLAVVSGACITPLLLPYIPGRAFSLKGALTGTLFAGVFIALSSPPMALAVFIAGTVVAASSFFAMNYSGASTYTSLSGVRREMRFALPIQIGMFGLALVGRIVLEMVVQRGAGV